MNLRPPWQDPNDLGCWLSSQKPALTTPKPVIQQTSYSHPLRSPRRTATRTVPRYGGRANPPIVYSRFTSTACTPCRNSNARRRHPVFPKQQFHTPQAPHRSSKSWNIARQSDKYARAYSQSGATLLHLDFVDVHAGMMSCMYMYICMQAAAGGRSIFFLSVVPLPVRPRVDRICVYSVVYA